MHEDKKSDLHYCKYCHKYVKRRRSHKSGAKHKKNKESVLRTLEHKLKKST